MSILGNEVKRVEDPRMLTAGGTYVGDVDLDGAAHVVFVRSMLAHAHLLSVDIDEAAAMPGVVKVVGADELGLAPLAPMMSPAEMARPILASGRVRFAGEPIVAVVAETHAQAVDAAEMVFVDYDPLPVVIDPNESLAGDVLLFDGVDSNVTSSFDNGSPLDFADCEISVELVVENSRMFASPIEPRVSAAAPDDAGRLVCWSSVQGAHTARGRIAGAIGVDLEQVRVVIPDVGGGFGAKATPGTEEIVVAWLARELDRPMRWTETRTENMLALGHGRAQTHHIEIGGSRDGRITHYRLKVLADCGGYAEMGSMLPMFTGMLSQGVYDIDNVEYHSTSVLTNTTPIAAFRGAGRPEASAAIERAVDRFAAEIDMDPAEVRRRNYVSPDAFPYTTKTNATYDVGDYEGSLDKALDACGYAELRADQAARRSTGERMQLGIGLATYVEITAVGGAPNITEFGSVELRPDGSILARTGSTPYGQGHVTTWAMVVADRLGVPMDQIEVLHGDTDEIPSSEITGGSRSAQIAGSSMHSASLHLIEAARPVAADLLEAAADDVVLDAERGLFHVTGTPARSISWSEVAAAAPTALVAENDFGQSAPTFPFGTHVAVVEVDTETGRVSLIRFVGVDDAGTLLNPLLAHGQVHGGIASGAAQALLEEIRYDDDGNLLTSNFADYGVISAAELPSFELVDQETPTPLNPLGAKGIGESGTIGSTPAVQNAVVDALSHLGIRHVDMPATAERVWRVINDR